MRTTTRRRAPAGVTLPLTLTGSPTIALRPPIPARVRERTATGSVPVPASMPVGAASMPAPRATGPLASSARQYAVRFGLTLTR